MVWPPPPQPNPAQEVKGDYPLHPATGPVILENPLCVCVCVCVCAKVLKHSTPLLTGMTSEKIDLFSVRLKPKDF